MLKCLRVQILHVLTNLQRSSSVTACDEKNSCDFSACYDDIEFTKVVIEDVSKMYCIDMDSIHMSGISNGGMFMYYAGKNSL